MIFFFPLGETHAVLNPLVFCFLSQRLTIPTRQVSNEASSFIFDYTEQYLLGQPWATTRLARKNGEVAAMPGVLCGTGGFASSVPLKQHEIYKH